MCGGGDDDAQGRSKSRGAVGMVFVTGSCHVSYASAQIQIHHKFGLEMGLGGLKNELRSVWIALLNRDFCSCKPKRKSMNQIEIYLYLPVGVA